MTAYFAVDALIHWFNVIYVRWHLVRNAMAVPETMQFGIPTQLVWPRKPASVLGNIMTGARVG